MAMYVYTVWLDYQGKWHCWEEVGAELIGCMPWAEASARKIASLLTGDNPNGGTADFIGTAKEAYCIHAPSRSKALTLVRRHRKAHRLSPV